MEKENKKLITVLTLSYNSPDIFGTIDSVLMQLYERIQYIIIDDASKEFSKPNVGKYIANNKKQNVESFEIIVNEENVGIIASLNKGLKLAKGDIIFNLAGDDQFADKNVLLDWVDEFDKTGAQIMTAKRDIYDSAMMERKGTLPTKQEIEIIKNSSPNELFEEMAGKNMIFGCCTARTKKSFDEFGLYDTRYRLIEDYSTALKLSRLGQKICFFDRVVVKYRRGGISTAEKINDLYIKDSNAIFENEVLPYTKNQKRAKKEYEAWKRGVRQSRHDAKFSILKEKYKKNKFVLFWVYVLYGICHPIKAFKKLIHRDVV